MLRAPSQVMSRVIAVKLGGGPTLLVLEDVHWMSAGSWALLAEAYEAMQPALVVMTMRPQAKLGKEAERALSAMRPHEITLHGLGEEDIGQLLCRTLGAEAMPEELPRLIRDKAEGNPLYAMEIARALRDQGHLTVDEGGAAHLSGNVNLSEMPCSVEALLTSRIDRLPAEQQLWLKIASLFDDTSFSMRMLLELSTHLPEARYRRAPISRLNLHPSP